MIPLSELVTYTIYYVHCILYMYIFSRDVYFANFSFSQFYFHDYLKPNRCTSSNLFVVLLPVELVNADDLTLGFIRVNDLNCLECVELNGGKEFLLCFHSKPLFYLMHI